MNANVYIITQEYPKAIFHNHANGAICVVSEASIEKGKPLGFGWTQQEALEDAANNIVTKFLKEVVTV